MFDGYVPDNYDAFRAYDAARAAEEERLPTCDICGEHIHERMYRIDGETLCETCLEDKYGESVEDYMNDNIY